MTPATSPAGRGPATRLLVVDPAREAFADARMADIPRLLRAGDVLVVNDSATIPASLAGHTSSGAAIEARLLGRRAHGGGGAGGSDAEWDAALFGEGDHHLRTEDCPAPPKLGVGARLALAGGLVAAITWVSPANARRVALAFEADERALWPALYRAGKPVQYAYVPQPLALWDVSTAYASRPWSVEPPSAGLALTGEILVALARQNVRLATVTHAAGLSSTGDAELDAALPLPERYAIPAATVAAIADARGCGRVVAVGTSVVRALEGCARDHGGVLRATEGTTDLRVGPGFRPRVVDGLLTGLHEPTASHYALLQAFAPEALLRRAYAHAEAQGYRGHELGDVNLILAA